MASLRNFREKGIMADTVIPDTADVITTGPVVIGNSSTDNPLCYTEQTRVIQATGARDDMVTITYAKIGNVAFIGVSEIPKKNSSLTDPIVLPGVLSGEWLPRNVIGIPVVVFRVDQDRPGLMISTTDGDLYIYSNADYAEFTSGVKCAVYSFVFSYIL